MTNAEIKKLYTKTKKAYEKRTNDKMTWVMNAQQQRRGTATIMTGMAWDHEDRLARAKKYRESFEKDWADRMADYNKKAREEAWKNEHKPGWYFGENDYYWQNIVANTEKLAASKADELARREKYVMEAEADLRTYGNYSRTLQAEIERAEALIAQPELQEFLRAIGGTAVVDVKENSGSGRYVHCAEVHVRFYYSAN